ncbi:hypothetical protein CPB86DRAFT_724005 [Serendipita vermifera]|nr:hypothetical protein CPB86DRAFT_724005 [Serendipita vermifera]
MPAVTLPLSFNNSFWSQEYRRGLETLFKKLEQGIAEDDEIINFIEARVAAEYDLATALSTPTPTGPRGTGFSADDGASLLMAFWGLKQETRAQGDGHRALANDLRQMALEPFSEWAKGHEQRIRDAKVNLLEMWLYDYEQSVKEVDKLRNTYHSKTRKADEAEDDAKFAPNNDYSDHYTATSPRLSGRNAIVNRTPSVSERIMERLKELRANKDDGSSVTTAVEGAHLEEPKDGETTPTLPKINKGKGKAVEETGSPLPMSPEKGAAPLPPPKQTPLPPILLAGIAMSPASVSALLSRAQKDIAQHTVRLPIVGEYHECFTGLDLVYWLRDNVEAFDSDIDRAATAAREIGEDLGLLRRIGELGNDLEISSEAFYQFRPKAFTLEQSLAEGDARQAVATNLQPVADNLLKRSNTLANFVMKQIKSGPAQPPHVRAREEAIEADDTYREAVRRLDRQRLALEDRIEESLKLLQRWELDRLRAIKDVLLKYHASLANLPSSIQPSIDRASTLIASYQPDSDLNALVERYRTGPFRPTAHVYESVSHDGTDVIFGIDLRKWAGDSGWAAVRVPEDEKKKDAIPQILSSLLQALDVAYAKLGSDDERRRTWIYEVPLPVVHHLREALNSRPADTPISVDFYEKVDAPVLAAVVKLWFLELDPPVGTWDGWEDFRKIYPSMSAKAEVSQEQRIEDIQHALFKLPRVHLYALDAFIKHLKRLVDHTKSEEDLNVYLAKLAYSLGRAILRPRQETEISIQDRHPTHLVIDLITHYDAILPPTIEKKKRESEKPLPMRKRTTLVDQRINRRSVGADPKQLLEARGAQMRAPSPARPEKQTTPATHAPTNSRASDDLPPRPKFATPPPEDDDRKATTETAPLVVSPPTPDRVGSPSDDKQPVSQKFDDSKSLALDDQSITADSANLSRSGSGEASRVRRPGGARGPRAAPGNTAISPATASPTHSRVGSGVSSDVAKMRSKNPSTAPAADPKEYVPRKKDGRTSAGAFGKKDEAGK